jgi:hypothetical protein
MTNENQKITASQSPKTITSGTSQSKRWVKNSSSLEENKGNSIKPLSLRPNRSIKRNLSLKPTGLGCR